MIRLPLACRLFLNIDDDLGQDMLTRMLRTLTLHEDDDSK